MNKEAEQEKRGRYPAAQAPWKLLPLALETYGRHGREALRHLRLLAKKRAQALDEGSDQAASALVLRWACRLSVALHRENARNLRRSVGVNLKRQRDELAADLASRGPKDHLTRVFALYFLLCALVAFLFVQLFAPSLGFVVIF